MSKFISDADMEALEKSSAPAAPAAPRKKAFISDTDMAALEGGVPKAAAPSFLEGIANTASSAADYVGRSARGEIPLAEQGERLGTLARGAGDFMQAVGDLPAKAIAAVPNYIAGKMGSERGLYDGAGAKETAKVLDSTGLADKAALETQDQKYPMARALGQSLPAMALGGTGIVAGAATSALGSVGGQMADTGTFNPEDVVFDAALGAAVPAALRGGKAVAKAAAPYVEQAAKWGGTQAARVVTGLPEDVIQTYATENKMARAMPKNALEGVARETTQAVGRVSDRATKGSLESFDILAREGVEVPRADVLKALQEQKTWLERTGDYGATRASDLNAMQRFIDNVSAEAGETMPGVRVKGLIQQIDEDLPVLQKKAGDRVTQGQAAMVGGRSNVDEMLKGQSESYRQQMAKVASDTELGKRVNATFGDEQQALNNLKGIARGNTPFREQTLDDLGSAMGDDFTKRAKVAMAKDAFTQRSVNGSRNVNLFSNIPVVGPLLGYAADYVARPATAKVIDWGVATRDALAKSNLPAKYGRVLEASAVKGPQSLLLTHQLLMQSDAEYRRLNGG